MPRNSKRGPYRKPPIAERFWEKVDKTGPCWLWTGALVDGYGTLGYESRRYFAHRLSYTLAHGPIPDGLCVCHNCPGGDNPRCVNPDHLFLGTRADNNHDAARKGQMQRGDAHFLRRHPERKLTGERHFSFRHPEWVARGSGTTQAKVTEDQVREMRALYAAGGITQKALSARYGITSGALRHMIARRTWAHVP